MKEAIIEREAETVTQESLLKETEKLAHIGSWQFNFKTGIGKWSDEAYRLIGFEPGEVAPILASLLRQVHPDDLRNVLESIKEVEANKDMPSKRMEHRVILNKTNEVRHLLTKIIIERDKKGEKIRAYGFNQDITATKLAEQKLLQSRAHLLTSQRIAHIGSWELDLCNLAEDSERILLWSDELYRIYGLDRKKFLPTVENVKALVHPEDRDLLYKKFAKSLETGKTYNYDYRIMDSDNIIRFLHGHGEVIREEVTGKPLKMIGTTQDVTERKEEEYALQISEANLRTIYDNTTTVYMLVDRDYKIVSFNKPALDNFYSSTGKTLKIGESALDYLAHDRRERAMDMYKRVFQGEKFKLEDKFVLKDGSTLWYYMQLLPVYGENNEVLNMTIYLRDVTGRKLAEIERDKINADLMQRNKDLEQFSYIISHNLRQPIANILGLTDDFDINRLSPEEQGEVIPALSKSVKRLDEVIQDLTHILSVHSGESENKQMIKLSDVLNDTSVSLGCLIKKENAIIESDFSEADELFTLKSYMHSIFYNLISNSIKYAQPALTPQIKISSRKEGNKLILTFRDNGLGIDLLKKGNELFGLYKRFHNHVNGKGMGLFMVKAQVESLGGKISVSSKVNKGTKFTIELEQ